MDHAAHARRGNLHMKGVGMLFVSVRGVNFEFWSHLECSEEIDIMCTSICSREGLV